MGTADFGLNAVNVVGGGGEDLEGGEASQVLFSYFCCYKINTPGTSVDCVK